MGVIPRSPIKLRLKGVSKAGSGRDRAHRDAGDAILPSGFFLQKSVPMYCSAFISHPVMYRDLDDVAPINFDHRLNESISGCSANKDEEYERLGMRC